MHSKKILAAGLSAALLMCSGLTASAAEKTPDNADSLIINVEAYKAAYPDLVQVFGDNTDAYVQHYLTMGVYEGRTKGVLFDPLTYAEAYSDVKNAFGYDIPSIVNHYVNYGSKENRTMGTAHGYSDIAAAESAGLKQYYLPKENIVSYNTSTVNYSDNGTSSAGNYGRGGSYVNTPSAPGSNNISAGLNTTATASNAGNTGAASNGWNYHHTTSIYHDDGKTLWRVEYYDENNNLKEYSSVTNVDVETNSYTENVYSYDTENNKEVLERTDTYVNGVLESSVSGTSEQ